MASGLTLEVGVELPPLHVSSGIGFLRSFRNLGVLVDHAQVGVTVERFNEVRVSGNNIIVRDLALK